MKLQDVIIWILFIISIIIGAWYLFGSSPTFEQAILVFVLTILFTMGINMGKIGTRLNLLERKFNSLAKDFKEHAK
jgi:ABC-type multidrug transport system fused ATPase/permease subunit